LRTQLKKVSRKTKFFLLNPIASIAIIREKPNFFVLKSSLPINSESISRLFDHQLSGEKSNQKKLVDTSLQLLLNEISHEQATDSFLEVIVELKLEENQLGAFFALEVACQTLGLFTASNSVRTLIHHKVAQQNLRRETWQGLYRGILSEIDQGNFDASQRIYKKLVTTSRSIGPFRRGIVDELDMYMFLWSNGNLGRISTRDEDKKFARILSGVDVHIVGPALGSDVSLTKNAMVARVMKPNVTVWEDIFSQCVNPPIVYCSGETTQWIENLSDRGFLREFSSVAIRPSSSLAKSGINVRQVQTVNHLILRGSPLMLTYMIFDLIRAKPSKMVISHFDFYTKPVAYRIGSRKTISSGTKDEKVVSPLGSDGQRFSRCDSFALHGVTYNRNLIKNIFSSSLIEADSSLEESLSLTNKQYCEVLDKIYGIDHN